MKKPTNIPIEERFVPHSKKDYVVNYRNSPVSVISSTNYNYGEEYPVYENAPFNHILKKRIQIGTYEWQHISAKELFENQPYYEKIVDIIIRRRNMLLVCGSVGVGKTIMAKAIAFALTPVISEKAELFGRGEANGEGDLKGKMKYGIIHSSSLFEILRLNTLRGIDDGAEEYDNLFRKIMFLTIDDCGAEKMTPFKEEKLDSIINDRYENNKNKETINQNVLSPINPITTILNTNLSAKDFNIAYPRIFSRFREGHIFTINSKDERK